MTAAPRDIRALKSAGKLQIDWQEGQTCDYQFVALRGECRCAGCVDERTGVRTLNLDSIPRDITIVDLKLVGNYALRISWSDGHSTGLYTWDHLHSLCSAPAPPGS